MATAFKRTEVNPETGEITHYQLCSICGQEKIEEAFAKRGKELDHACIACRNEHAIVPQTDRQTIALISRKLDDALPLREQHQETFSLVIAPYTQILTEELVRISVEGDKDADRIKAITYLLDRLLGRPDQNVTVRRDDLKTQAEQFLDMWKPKDVN